MPSVTEDGEVQGARLSRAIGGLALFDLDRTLVPDSSLVILARALASRRLVTTTALLSAMARNAKFVRGGASDATAAKTRDRVLAAVAGLEQSALSDVAHGVGRDVAADRGPGARWLLDRHLARGDFCVLVSASPQELVETVGREAGFHRALGTRAEVVEGHYTGRLDGASACATSSGLSIR